MSMKIGFIGAGRVGFTLGKYFSEGGLDVSGYFSQHPDSAKEAAVFTNTKQYQMIHELVFDSDVLFLTVPDGSIASVYDVIKQECVKHNFLIEGKIICHCSGALSSEEAFPDIALLGAFGYSIHPLFAVSDKLNAYREMTDVFFAIEGMDAYMETLLQLLSSLGNPVQIISAAAKAKYHAAAAIASNQVVALASQSIKLLEECGFSSDSANSALKPILLGNMQHIVSSGILSSLTGPAERNDIHTVEKHLLAFESEEDKKLYCLLTKKIIRLAKQKHEHFDYSEILCLLNSYIY